jgi:pimeloyl-ACP methyl ester carboxylesterase
MTGTRVIALTHGKLRLALHELRPGGDGHALLLLHGLGEQSPRRLPEPYAGWPGAVYALDFTGHGASDLPIGGGYTAEILMGDVDAALAEIGPATVCGRGLGAYVALMIAGGRPAQVVGAILCDGPGLAGGGPQPSSPHVIHPDPHASGTPDAFALAELSSDLRPPDYAMSYVRQINHLGRIERPIAVCAVHRPDWLAMVCTDADTETVPLEEALATFAKPRWRSTDGD